MSWSSVDTEYSIHRVQHLPKIVCLLFIVVIMSWPLNVDQASSVPPYTIDSHQTSYLFQLRCKVTCSQSHGCELTDWWTESQHPVCHPLTAIKYSSKLAGLGPPSSHNDDLQEHLKTGSIMDCKWICPNMHDLGHQVHLHTRSITSLQSCWNAASKCTSGKSLNHCISVITKLTQLHSRSANWGSLDCVIQWFSSSTLHFHLQVHLQTRSITALECITEFTG